MRAVETLGERKDDRALRVITNMVAGTDLETAAQLALKWLETYSPPWSATMEISALRAALKQPKAGA